MTILCVHRLFSLTHGNFLKTFFLPEISGRCTGYKLSEKIVLTPISLLLRIYINAFTRTFNLYSMNHDRECIHFRNECTYKLIIFIPSVGLLLKWQNDFSNLMLQLNYLRNTSFFSKNYSYKLFEFVCTYYILKYYIPLVFGTKIVTYFCFLNTKVIKIPQIDGVRV